MLLSSKLIWPHKVGESLLALSYPSVLTDDREVDLSVARGRLLEVDAAAVDPAVRVLDALQGELGGSVARAEEGATSQDGVLWPVASTLHWLAAGVVAAQKQTSLF